MANVIEHRCMVVTKKQNQQAIDSVLRSVGITNVQIPKTFRDVTELALQEMPHVIILESDLDDCSVMMCLKKLKESPSLTDALFFVIRKFSKEEIMECVNLKVSAMLQQPFDPAALLKKMKPLLLNLKGQSPFRIDANRLPGGANVSTKVSGRISSTQGDYFTVETNIAVASGKQITLRPTDTKKPSVRVTSAGPVEGSSEGGKTQEVLFSYESASGRGREWLLAMKEAKPEAPKKRPVLVLETNAERGAQFVQMLSFYDIEATHVQTFEKLRMFYEAKKDLFKVIYLCEPPIHASGISWDKYARGLPEGSRPTQVIATSSARPAPKPNVIWMPMPFGLDALVERFEAAFAQSAAGGESEATKKEVTKTELNISFFADVVSIDECGALLECPYELSPNCRLNLTHPALSLIELSKNVRVSGVKKMDAGGAKFRARITNQEGNFSKGRYWNPILEKLTPVLEKPVPAKKPAAKPPAPSSTDAA